MSIHLLSILLFLLLFLPGVSAALTEPGKRMGLQWSSSSAADVQHPSGTRLLTCSHNLTVTWTGRLRCTIHLPRPPSGICCLLLFLLLLLLLLLLLDLAGLLHGELAQPLGQRHPSGSGRISDGESHHVLVHHLRQLHAAKLSVQLTGQLPTAKKPSDVDIFFMVVVVAVSAWLSEQNVESRLTANIFMRSSCCSFWDWVWPSSSIS